MTHPAFEAVTPLAAGVQVQVSCSNFEVDLAIIRYSSHRIRKSTLVDHQRPREENVDLGFGDLGEGGKMCGCCGIRELSVIVRRSMVGHRPSSLTPLSIRIEMNGRGV